MSKYRKKSALIEAFKYNEEVEPDWFTELVTRGDIKTSPSGGHQLHTDHGVLLFYDGDYIVRGSSGEVYPCSPGIFEVIHEKVY